MRFLLSLPLPLLLILVPFVPSSYAHDEHARLAESSLSNKSTIGSVSPPNFENRSLSEVQNQLQLERVMNGQLKAQVDAARKALEDKRKEASGPIGAYNKSREEWERLDAIVKEKSIELDRLKKIADEAGKNVTKAGRVFNDIDASVTDQENNLKPIQDALDEIEKKIAEIKDTPNRLKKTNETVQRLTLEKKNMEATVNTLAGQITTQNTEVENCKSGANGWQETFNEKGCEYKAKTGECEQPNKYLNEWNTKWKNAVIALNETIDGHSKATNKLQELNNESSVAEVQLTKLQGDIDQIDILINIQNITKTMWESRKAPLEPPLLQAREDRRKAQEALESAKAIKIQADSNVTSYSNAGLQQAQNDADLVKGDMNRNEDVKNDFDKPLRDLEKTLNDLNDQLVQSNLRIDALQKQEEKLSPKTAGGDSILTVLGISALAIVVVIVGVVIVVCLLRKRRKDKNPGQPTDKNTNRTEQTSTRKKNSKDTTKEAEVEKSSKSKELTNEMKDVV